MRKAVLILLVLWHSCFILAQDDGYLYRLNQYNFIRYDLNELHNFGHDDFSSRFFEKLDALLETGEGQINVVHIGGSHIQAGTFTGQIRHRLQTMNGDLNAGWGYMFPYRISRTNSPFGYFIRFTGSWQGCRNVERRKTCTLGVGGISARTASDEASLTILLEKENMLDYRFNTLRIFFETMGAKYTVSVDSTLLKERTDKHGFIQFDLNSRVDSITVFIKKPTGDNGTFTLFGLETESAPNGILYHSIGINGAYVPAFLRCQLFEQQLEQLHPDLVILGLGINDAYTRRFSRESFEENYTELIGKIRTAAPNAAIILTTNNDSYIYRRYLNNNGEKVMKSMFYLSEKFETGVWDMYTVMGGLNSVVLWEHSNLAQPDKIHFTREGYLLLGDLFFNALMQGFENWYKKK